MAQDCSHITEIVSQQHMVIGVLVAVITALGSAVVIWTRNGRAKS